MAPPSGPRVMLAAGEASGDLHAAGLVRALTAQRPGVRCFGMGGADMAQAGVEILVDCRPLAVMGLAEVVRHYPKLRAALRRLRQVLRARRPELLILVDYPEFNLKLAATAQRLGIKVLFYVSPQVWAWRANRVNAIRRRVDMMAVVFPFEVAWYERAGVPVRFVGHPLVERARPTLSRPQALATFRLDTDYPIVGLFPGSRRSEIQQLMPILIETARLLSDRFEGIQFILPVASSLSRDDFNAWLPAHPIPIRIVETDIYNVLQSCDAVVTASGTATLQIALLQTPMTIVYRISTLTYWLVRRLVGLEHVGLVNIVAGRLLVREFIQGDARAPRVADEITRLLSEPDYAQRMRAGLARMQERLGGCGGSERVAALAADMLAGRI